MPSAHPPRIPSHLPQWPNQWQWQCHNLLSFKVGALFACSAVLFAASPFMTLLTNCKLASELVRRVHFPVWQRLRFIHFLPRHYALFPVLFPKMSALVILHVPTFHPVLLGASAVPTHCFICHFSVKSQCSARSPEAAVFTVASSMMLSLSVIFNLQWFCTLKENLVFFVWRHFWFHNLVGGDCCCHLGRSQGGC